MPQQDSAIPSPDLGATYVELDGLTIISIKPYSYLHLLGILFGGLIFAGIGFWMFHNARVPPMFLLFMSGFLLLFILVPAYMTIFTADVFVISTDKLEKRWSCKPFHRCSQIPRSEIQSVRVNSRQVRTKNGSRTVWFVELAKTDGKSSTLINGGDIKRLNLASDYLNKALFGQHAPPPPAKSL
ncbi:MAG TPA: hypothetical protein VMG59_11625 [Phycisphaerae bacterium]|nr:hypothetical protein [Phycisphaerae bacterium]